VPVAESGVDARLSRTTTDMQEVQRPVAPAGEAVKFLKAVRDRAAGVALASTLLQGMRIGAGARPAVAERRSRPRRVPDHRAGAAQGR
jgi:hypothetical protein